MPSITLAQVRHVAHLARLTLTDAEVERSVHELSAILDYVDVLQEVDTKNVEPTAQVNGCMNTLREDNVCVSLASSDRLLSCSPLPIVRHQIQTPAAHG